MGGYMSFAMQIPNHSLRPCMKCTPDQACSEYDLQVLNAINDRQM